MTTTSLAEAIRGACLKRQDAETLVLLSRGTLLTALGGHALLSRAEACSRHLAPLHGQSVVLVFPFGSDFITVFLGCLLAGVTAIPVSPPRRGSAGHRLVHICAESRPAVVLCPPAQVAATRAMLGTPSPVTRGWASDAPETPLRPGPDEVERPGTVLVQYTSGSTRDPKGVCVTGDNVLENCGTVMRAWDMDETCRFVNWMPHFHDMGLIGGILYPLLCGGMSVQMSPFDFIRSPLTWLRAVSDWRATFSGGPAFAFADLLTRTGRDEVAALDLSSWRRAFCGAEPVPPGLLERVETHLAPAGLRRGAVFACYGMAEMTLYAGGRPRDPDAGLPAHGCGLPHDVRAAMAIVDPATQTALPDGQEGEIWLGGPSQCAGYLRRPDDTAHAFGQSLPGRPGHFLRTGDLGRIERDTLFISGRIKDVLFAHGLTIPAAEVEWTAGAQCPGVNPLAAAAFMRDDTRSGDAVLVIEQRRGKRDAPPPTKDLAAMRRAVEGEWGLTLSDIRIVPSGSLPRTTSGKIRRAQVAAHYRNTGSDLLHKDAV